MPNNHTQDLYQPDGIGSEFEEHYFSELNEGEIFRIHDNNNASTVQFRKENETQAMGVKDRIMYDFAQGQIVYTKI